MQADAGGCTLVDFGGLCSATLPLCRRMQVDALCGATLPLCHSATLQMSAPVDECTSAPVRQHGWAGTIVTGAGKVRETTLAADPGSWSPLVLAILGPWSSGDIPGHQGTSLAAAIGHQLCHQPCSLVHLYPEHQAVPVDEALPVPVPVSVPAPVHQPCYQLCHQPCSPVHLHPEHRGTSIGASGESGKEGPRPARGGGGSAAPWCHRSGRARIGERR